MATKSRIHHLLTDTYVSAVQDFAEGAVHTVWDSRVPGLQVRVGKRRTTWVYFQQRRVHGKRETTYKRLGFWPATDVKEARKQALIVAGRVAATSRPSPGRQEAIKFKTAIADYIAESEKSPKGAAWVRNVKSLYRNHLKRFDDWTLVEMADAPGVFKEWHTKLTKQNGPIVANRAGTVIRATYALARTTDRSLPPYAPTSAVSWNVEERSQRALPPADFPKWLEAWSKVDNPYRQAFYRLNLLCGFRPGEGARLRWCDVLLKERCFVIVSPKRGGDIRIPLSLPIIREFKRARDAARAAGRNSPFVFPGRGSSYITPMQATDELPAAGMDLRRTFRTEAFNIGLDELHTKFLMGHKPQGISAGYIAKLIASSSSGLRASQRRMSAHIEGLLKGRA